MSQIPKRSAPPRPPYSWTIFVVASYFLLEAIGEPIAVLVTNSYPQNYGTTLVVQAAVGGLAAAVMGWFGSVKGYRVLGWIYVFVGLTAPILAEIAIHTARELPGG